MRASEPDRDRRPFFRRADLLIGAVVLLGAGIWLALALLPPDAEVSPGGVAVATIVGDENGDFTREIPLDTDADIDIDGGLFPVHLQVRDGAIRFVNSECPDHLCEGFGWLRHEGDAALCAPAGVSLRVIEGSNG